MKPFKKPFSTLAKVYQDFFSDGTRVKYVPNYKADISLKQRYANKATVFVLDRSCPGAVPVLHGRKGSIKARLAQPVVNTLKTKWYDPFESIDVGSEPTARARRSKRSLIRELDIRSRWHYLSEGECTRIITRIVNRLNRRLFKGRACRTNDPERVTVLACMHDKKTRRHFHLLFGVPPHISEFVFKQALNEALSNEPFVYRRRKVGRIVNLANAIGYNVEPAKSRTGNPVIFEAWQRPNTKESETNDRPNTKQLNSDHLLKIAA